MVLISVIIPVYNHSKELLSALESISNQTIKDLEVIVVDDGSSATDRQYLRENILPNFNQVKFIFAEHKGASAARNRGFKEASGQYIIFWDADITAVPTMLKKMYEALVNHPDAAFAYSSFNFGWKQFTCGAFDIKRLRQTNFITTTSLIKRTDFPGFDETLGKFQDWDLWLSVTDNGKIGIWVPEVLFTIKTRANGISTWLPAFVYKFPWLPIPALKKYFYWKNIVQKKNKISD